MLNHPLNGNHSENLLREIYRKRVKIKKGLDTVFLITLIPVLAILVSEDLRDFPSGFHFFILVAWFILFVILTIVQSRIWRCPKCQKPLSKWSDKAFYPPPAKCRHCDFLLWASVDHAKSIDSGVEGRKP